MSGGVLLDVETQDIVPQLLHKSPSFGRPPNPKLVHSKVSLQSCCSILIALRWLEQSILILHTTDNSTAAEGFLYLGSHNLFVSISRTTISKLIHYRLQYDSSMGNGRTTSQPLQSNVDHNKAESSGTRNNLPTQKHHTCHDRPRSRTVSRIRSTSRSLRSHRR